MEKKKVIIIGAGISGLTLGIKLLQNGYDVSIYEKNDEVGGLCSGFFVDGFYVDACLHWLTGTKMGSRGINQIWINNDMLNDDVNIISLPTLGTFEYKGTSVTFYRDLDKTCEEWIKISKEDEKEIKKFFSLIKLVDYSLDFISKIGVENNFLGTLKTIIKMIPKSTSIIRSLSSSREKYAKKIKNEAIRFALKNVQNGYNNMLFFLYEYAIFINGNADIPEGGALYMMLRAKERFLSLGGDLHLSSPVNQILVNDNKAIGINSNNIEINSDYVISTVDPFFTLDILLNEKYKDKKYNKLKKHEHKNKIVSCFDVYFTIEEDLSNIDVPLGLEVDFKCGAKNVNSMLFRSYHFDPKYFIKDGKTVVSVIIDQDKDDFIYWSELYNKAKELYDREVQEVIDNIKKTLINRFPNFEGKINLLTKFGPVEIKNRSNNIFGSIQSFSFSSKSSIFSHKFRIKGLDNFFIASQWSKSIGGTPMAAYNATSCAKEIINSYGRGDE